MIGALCPVQIHSYPKIVKLPKDESFFHSASARSFVFDSDTVGLSGDSRQVGAFLFEVRPDRTQDLRKAPRIARVLGLASAHAELFVQSLDIGRSIVKVDR